MNCHETEELLELLFYYMIADIVSGVARSLFSAIACPYSKRQRKMIESELLQEKYRVQKKLTEECKTVREYLKHSHLAAKEIAKSRGFSPRYVELSNNTIQFRKSDKQ
ncbi:MAG: hypothetical protein QNJ55_23430 [Xenococcus sp. MO_188.B8]|nr:hypothetical protein [Xenococcus sp. MO_188.B8]